MNSDRYLLRRTSVQSFRRCSSEGDLPCNMTIHLDSGQKKKKQEIYSVEACRGGVHSQVSRGILVGPVGPATRPGREIPWDRRSLRGPRPLSFPQRPWDQCRPSLLPGDAGGRTGHVMETASSPFVQIERLGAEPCP